MDHFLRHLVEIMSSLCSLVLLSTLLSLCWSLKSGVSCQLLPVFQWNSVFTLLLWLLQLFKVSRSSMVQHHFHCPNHPTFPAHLLYCIFYFTSSSKYLKIRFMFVLLVKATTTPTLPENFNLAHLLKADIQLETEIKPR